MSSDSGSRFQDHSPGGPVDGGNRHNPCQAGAGKADLGGLSSGEQHLTERVGRADENGPVEEAGEEVPVTEAIRAVAVPVLRDTSEPLNRLHWSSAIFDTFSHFRQYVVPAAFAFYGAARGDWFWGALAIFSFGVSFLATLFRYFTLQYGIRNGELVIHQGLIFHNVRIIPVRRIQNMDLQQNVLHRLFGVAEVRIETASGSEAEAVLRVLTRPQIEKLRALIYEARAGGFFESNERKAGTEEGPFADAASMSDPVAVVAPRQAEEEQELLRIPVRWLVAAGLASNRGWLLVGLGAGLWFQFMGWDRFDNSSVREQFRSGIGRYLPSFSDFSSSGLQIALWLAAGFAVLKLLGIAWFVTRFFGYRLTRQGDDLRLTSGLLTSYSATVPRGRIQFISVQRTLVMRWMGLAAVRIETAGGAGGEGGEASGGALSRSWFVPVIPVAEVPRILSQIRPGLAWDESQVEWKGLSSRTRQRLMRVAAGLSILMVVAGEFYSRPWGWIPGVLAFAWFAWYAWRTSRSLRYARTPFGLAFRSGLLTRKLALTFFDRLQTVRVDQSPFDRRWGMATLSVDTAAAGPAENVVQVPYLDEAFAVAEFQYLQRQATSHRPVWQ